MTGVQTCALPICSTALDAQGYWPVDCGLTKLNGTLDFTFDNVTIRVPYKELIRSFNGNCVLGLSSNSNFMLLGDTFLRSAYMVFDQDSDCVWMSQYVNCGASPAALESTRSLRTLEGKCSLQVEGPGAGSAAVSPQTNSTTPPPAMRPPSTITSSPVDSMTPKSSGPASSGSGPGTGRPAAGWGTAIVAMVSVAISTCPLLV